MGQTPDRFPGVRLEEGIILSTNPAAAVPGEIRFDGSNFSMVDSGGAFDPNSIPGTLPPTTAQGQVLYSVDGSTLTVQTPVTSSHGWLVEASEGLLIVMGGG